MNKRKDRTKTFALHSRFRVGDLQVLPDRLMVVRDNEEVPLEPRMMEVLIWLAERADETVSTRELLDDVWNTKVYDSNPVQATINRLRKAIGDSSRKSCIIETVVGIGYRLIAAVSFPAGYQPRPRRDEPWGPEKGSPYVGLDSYDEKHSKVFHGRRTLTEELLEAMRNQLEDGRRFVLIDGPSGCGKSSVLRAGAIPQLTSAHGVDGMRALAVAFCNLAAMTDGDHVGNLVATLGSLKLDERPVFPTQPSDELKALLIDHPEYIDGFIEEAFRRHRDRKKAEQHLAHVLLVIDHAEALVPTEFPDKEMLGLFVQMLNALCNNQHTLVIMISRRDAYPKLIDNMPTLKELKAGKGHVEVFPPRSSEIRDIIVRPAAQASLSFEVREGRLDNATHKIANAKTEIGTGIDRTQTFGSLDNVLYEATTRQPDALPLLQHTLQYLYERKSDKGLLTFDAYAEIGGLEGAIAHRAEAVFSKLSQKSRDALDSVLRRLILMQTGSDITGTRRGHIDALSTNAHDLVQAFIDARLFVTGLHDDGRPSFGLAHEALLRQWPRARSWIEENRNILRAKARLEQAVEHWKSEGFRDDHLLNSGRPLEEALEVKRFSGDPLDSITSNYVARSALKKTRLKRIRVMVMCILFIVTSISVIMTVSTIISRNDAISQKKKSSDLSSFIVGELAEKLDASADLDILESIGAKVLEYCSTINSSNSSTDDLVSCSEAAIKVGEVRMEQNRTAEAEALFLRSIDYSKQAISDDPNNEQAVIQFGRSYSWLGIIRYNTGDYLQAINLWKVYLQCTDELLAKNPNKSEFLIERSFALSNIGTGFYGYGNFQAAKENLTDSINFGNSAISQSRPNDEWEYQVIVTKAKLADIESNNGDLHLADQLYSDLTIRLKNIIGENTKMQDRERQLASFLQFHAKVLSNMGRTDDAREKINHCIRILSALSEKEPDNKRWKKFLAQALILSSDLDRFENLNEQGLLKLIKAEQLIDDNRESSISIRRIKAEILFRKGMLSRENQSGALMSDAILMLKEILSEKEDRQVKLSLVECLILRSILLKKRNLITQSNEQTELSRKILSSFKTDGTDTLVNAYRNMSIAISNGLPETGDRTAEEILDLSQRGYKRPDYVALMAAR
jgi:eukaryotic-like serine/threonine-protein kinase